MHLYLLEYHENYHHIWEALKSLKKGFICTNVFIWESKIISIYKKYRHPGLRRDWSFNPRNKWHSHRPNIKFIKS